MSDETFGMGKLSDLAKRQLGIGMKPDREAIEETLKDFKKGIEAANKIAAAHPDACPHCRSAVDSANSNTVRYDCDRIMQRTDQTNSGWHTISKRYQLTECRLRALENAKPFSPLTPIGG